MAKRPSSSLIRSVYSFKTSFSKNTALNQINNKNKVHIFLDILFYYIGEYWPYKGEDYS